MTGRRLASLPRGRTYKIQDRPGEVSVICDISLSSWLLFLLQEGKHMWRLSSTQVISIWNDTSKKPKLSPFPVSSTSLPARAGRIWHETPTFLRMTAAPTYSTCRRYCGMLVYLPLLCKQDHVLFSKQPATPNSSIPRKSRVPPAHPRSTLSPTNIIFSCKGDYLPCPSVSALLKRHFQPNKNDKESAKKGKGKGKGGKWNAQNSGESHADLIL